MELSAVGHTAVDEKKVDLETTMEGCCHRNMMWRAYRGRRSMHALKTISGIFTPLRKINPAGLLAANKRFAF
jgi:hypothetical protein